MPSPQFPGPARAARAVLHGSFPFLLIAVLTGACKPAAELRHDAAGDDPPHARGDTDSAVVAEDAGARAHDASSGLDPSADAAKSPPDAALDTGAQSHPDAASSGADAASLDASAMTYADASTGDAAAQPERSADFAVGTRRIEVSTDGGRLLPVQLWYPALDTASAEAATGHAFEEFEVPGARRELLKKLFAAAPSGCPNPTMHAAIDAKPYPRSAPFPVLVYSHHFDGTRFSMFSIAEALARAGRDTPGPASALRAQPVGASQRDECDVTRSLTGSASGAVLLLDRACIGFGRGYGGDPVEEPILVKTESGLRDSAAQTALIVQRFAKPEPRRPPNPV